MLKVRFGDSGLVLKLWLFMIFLLIFIFAILHIASYIEHKGAARERGELYLKVQKLEDEVHSLEGKR